MQDMIRRQMPFLGHVIHKDELGKKVVLTGYVEGKRDQRKTKRNILDISQQTQKV